MNQSQKQSGSRKQDWDIAVNALKSLKNPCGRRLLEEGECDRAPATRAQMHNYTEECMIYDTPRTKSETGSTADKWRVVNFDT